MLNEAETIGALLQALAAQTCPADEIIMVDGGSTDDTVAIVQNFGEQLSHLRLIVAPGNNISQGRNRGIAATDCPLIAVTDAGCIPAPTWLENLLKPFEDQIKADLVCGVYRTAPQNDFEDCIGRCSTTGWLRLQGQTVRPTARSLAFTRAAWQAIGGFPEQTYALDDLGFVLALVDQGHRMQTALEALVDWRPRSSYGDVLRQFHLYARDTARAGLTWRIYRRTLAQDVILAGLLLWGVIAPGPLPWLLLTGAITAYLYRKARQGCFATPDWRTLYRVPLILGIIHLGAVSGIAEGLLMRLGERI